MMTWTLMAQGNFNLVYVNENKTKVLKVPIWCGLKIVPTLNEEVCQNLSQLNENYLYVRSEDKLYFVEEGELVEEQTFDSLRPKIQELMQAKIQSSYLTIEDGAKLFKIDKVKSILPPHNTDIPRRAVRLWNEINAEFGGAQEIEREGFTYAWECPFIEGQDACDAEIAKILIEIYQKTGRIVLDALTPGNVLKTSQGKIICVDVGYALQLETRQNKRQSTISLSAWNKELQINFQEYFKPFKSSHPLSVNVVQSLLFLKNTIPDETRLDFLITNPELTQEIVSTYNKSHSPNFFSTGWTKSITQLEMKIKNEIETLDCKVGKEEMEMQIFIN